VQRLEASFKQKALNLKEEDGDKNSFGEYKEFMNSDNIEY
jgi:hypothetical protein